MRRGSKQYSALVALIAAWAALAFNEANVQAQSFWLYDDNSTVSPKGKQKSIQPQRKEEKEVEVETTPTQQETIAFLRRVVPQSVIPRVCHRTNPAWCYLIEMDFFEITDDGTRVSFFAWARSGGGAGNEGLWAGDFDLRDVWLRHGTWDELVDHDNRRLGRLGRLEFLCKTDHPGLQQ
jgi:hypothetical protein